MAYCEPSDLLIGNIPTPAYISSAQYIKTADNEIDIMLSSKYVVPVTDPNRLQGTAGIILKQASLYIASGRLILAAAAGGSDDSTHAYGNRMIRDGQAIIRRALLDDDVLGDLELIDKDDSDTSGVPIIKAGDESSLVEGFYSQVGGHTLGGRTWLG